MRTHHAMHSSHEAGYHTSSNPIITQTSYATMHDVKSALITAAHKAGCQFLFEVPANLFGFEKFKAAAIKLNVGTHREDLAFILMNEQNGVLHIISQKEAPPSIIRFVNSYAKVLGLLQQHTATSH